MAYTVSVSDARSTLLRRTRTGSRGTVTQVADQTHFLVDGSRADPSGHWDNGWLRLLPPASDTTPRRVVSWDYDAHRFTVDPPFGSPPSVGTAYEVSRFLSFEDALDIMNAALADYWPLLAPVAWSEVAVPTASFRLTQPAGFADFGVQQICLEPIVSQQDAPWPPLEGWEYLPDGVTIQLPVHPTLAHRGRKLRLIGIPPKPVLTEGASITFLDAQRYEVYLRLCEAELWAFMARFPAELDVATYLQREQLVRAEAYRRLRQLGVALPFELRPPFRQSRGW